MVTLNEPDDDARLWAEFRRAETRADIAAGKP
jgi:hypothetical protein